MTSVKIDRHAEIDELLAKIYLDTHIKLSKKELLELIFDITKDDYDLLLQNIKNGTKKDDIDLRKSFINTFSGVLNEVDEEIDPKSIWVTDVEE